VSPPGHEPAILGYLGLLWRRRFLIVFGSLVPALAVGAILHYWPSQYKATFVYERPLTESQYNVLLRRFYSSENLGKIVGRLEAVGLTSYAERLGSQETERSLQRLIGFSVWPEYPKRLLTTDPTTSERISNFEAQLLHIDITADSKETVAKAAAVITDNIESVLPVYEIRNGVHESIRKYTGLVAEIDESRYTLTLDLQQEQAKLEKLMALGDDVAEGATGDITLQFADVQASREFLPLPYQRRAVQSKIIDVQEKLNSDKKKYTYYNGVLKLNAQMLEEIEGGILTYYTVEQFLGFLGAKLLDHQKDQDSSLSDYLKSYIHKTQNLVLANTRAGESPVVYPLPKRLVSRAALTLVVFLMVTTFAAVLLEYRSEHRRGGRS